MNSFMTAVISSAAEDPGKGWSKVRVAFLRALRTFLQGVAGAFPAAGAGMAILSSTYWLTFGYSILAALIASVVSFLQNLASFLPSGDE